VNEWSARADLFQADPVIPGSAFLF
jgi:hypothetical protein